MSKQQAPSPTLGNSSKVQGRAGVGTDPQEWCQHLWKGSTPPLEGQEKRRVTTGRAKGRGKYSHVLKLLNLTQSLVLTVCFPWLPFHFTDQSLNNRAV